MSRFATIMLVLCLTIAASAQTVLNPSDDLANAVNAAAPGSTLLLNPGTYSLSTTLTVMKSLTIRNNQATRPTILVPPGTITTVHLLASNITLDGVNVSGGYWGIYAGDPNEVPPVLTNIAIRNLTVDTNPSSVNSGHGILLRKVTNATVDNVTVVDAHANGIMVDEGSDNAIIVNNTVQSTVTQHAIAVKNSNGVTVAGNTITGSGFHGIILVGAQNGSVIRNNLSGVKYDGITLDKEPATGRFSTGNYIGNNTIVSTTRLSGVVEGTGIWLNSESNGTLVYANSTTGAPENGLTVFNASYNHFMGNVTWDNSEGGIFIYGPTGLSYSTGPQPSYTVVQGNYAYNLPVNAGVNLRQSTNSTVFDNFVRGTPGSTTTGGVFLQTTSNNQVFQNTLANLQIGLYAYADTASSSYFLNRHLTAMQTFVFSPATVTPDGGSIFGGNYWAGHNAAAPYTNIIYNGTGAPNGPYQDRYPFPDDTLNQQPYVTVLYPTAGAYASIGSQKTIEWRSGGCTYVDLFYRSGGTNVSISSNYPDVGFYRWTVPSLPQASDYTIFIDCKNSANQSLNVNAQSGAFTIAKTGIELLTPQGNERLTAGAQAAVAWKRTAAVAAVDVLYRSGTSAFSTVLASGVIADSTTVTVPATATSRGSFLVRATNDNAIADSTDGFVNIRSAAAPQVTAPAGPLQVGTLHQVEWTSPTTSLYVDVEYWDTTASTFRTLVQNLPDFGRFTFLVPDKVMTASYLRVRFKSSAAGVITTANSGFFNTTATTGGGGTTPATPASVSVAPASGSGASTTFSAVYSDANGGADISLAYLLVNSSINAAGGCFIEYNRSANTYRLIDDAGATWSGAISAGQSAQNSQCTLAPAGTTGSASGDNLTVNFPITFKTAFAGAKNVYLLATDAGGANSGWQARGTWTVSGGGPGPVTGEPSVVSLSPLSGSATANTFTATYSHPSGVNGHYLGYMLFLPTPNVVNYVATGSCLVEYNRISTGMRLIDNAGTGWLGGQSGVTIGTPGATLQNNHCTLNIAQSTASISGNTMTVNAVVSFKPGFTGVLGTFLQELDVNGVWTGMTQFGNWLAYSLASPKPGPYIVGGAPQSGSGSSTTYSLTTGHTSGIGTLSMVHLLISDRIVGGSPCQIVFFPTGNHVVLINSAGTDLVPGFITPGSNTGTLSNGRCTVSGNGMTRANSGNNVTISMPVSFNAGTFGGAKKAYANVFDNNGLLTHWQQFGAWTVQ